MTKTESRTATSKDEGPRTRRQKRDEPNDLDAEIVRDLELNDHAADVRGGDLRETQDGIPVGRR